MQSALIRSIGAALDERRLFVLVPFAIITGLIASTAVGAEPEPLALIGVGVVLCVLLYATRRNLVALRLTVLAAAFLLGFSLLAMHGALSGTVMLERTAYGAFEARVDEVISEGEAGRRVIVSAIAPTDATTRAVPIRRARLFAGDGPDIAPGDLIRGKIRFYPVPGPVLPGAFDAQFHGYFAGIGAYANTIGPLEVVASDQPFAPARVIDGVRTAIAARIDADLAQPEAGIARSLITGDQSAVDDGARTLMSIAGIAHVLSVSGLHLTIVAGGVFAAFRLMLALSETVARRLGVKRVAAGAGIVAALLYYAISGGNVAALRATVMIVLVLGAVIVGRRALTMRNVAIAALVVLLSDPASVFRPSFQLSFAAVVALIGAWEVSRGRERKGARSLWSMAVAYFGGAAATSLVAGTATLLFSAYHFQQTSPLGVLGNLVTLPLVGFIMMPSAVFAVLAMPFGFEGPFLMALGWSIARMLDVARLVAGLSAGVDASPLLSPVSLVIGFVALGWFAFFRDRWRLLGPALAVPAVLLFGLDRPPDVLIADTTQAVAVRTADGLWLVTGKPGSFALNVWSETYGEPIAAGDFSCDSVGCIATGSGGFTVSVVIDPSGFYEDCDSADLVVTRRDAPAGCAAPVVIDGEDLRLHGVHWLAWDVAARRFIVRPAISDLNRPWRAARQ